MDGEAIAAVSVAVVMLTQLLKWGRIVTDSRGPLAVLILAAIGVVLWAVANEPAVDRRLVWPYFVGWVTIATAAAGIFGFTRALPEAVTSTRPPPAGAAQNATAGLDPPRG